MHLEIDPNKQLKQKIDYCSSLKTEEEKLIFDKLKAVRLELAKNKNLKAAYLVCKDEHLAAIVQNPNITFPCGKKTRSDIFLIVNKLL